ncbi:hypothetical protein A7C91_01965 [Thermococcus piezophilus]|uniref:Uncharacterized protein n=1 Tax=Thermococcus piezophilus TaxID=1712654 RepID=A0A172WF82_9EURY|nr:hypothetical protein A7C91_01965 [Thermococcus piezophilus]
MFLIGGTVITSTVALLLKSNPTKPTAMLILVLLFVFEILIGSYYVFIAHLRNSVITSEIRASAISMISLVNSGVGMVVLPLFLALGNLATTNSTNKPFQCEEEVIQNIHPLLLLYIVIYFEQTNRKLINF